MKQATVIGAGLAGCEAALALARAGVAVELFEQKPAVKSPAHTSDLFAELVCSNSLKAERIESAAGLLKAEMALAGSVCMEAAQRTRVPAGGALAVDRAAFARAVTDAVRAHPNIIVRECRMEQIPESGVCVIATGPLTDGAFAQAIADKVGEDYLSFYDAAAPIITAESVDQSLAFSASRYDRGGEDDYLNCPMNKEEYERFYQALVDAECAQLHVFDRPRVYEGCMPVEIMARRGEDTLRFGPLKPVGLRDPATGRRPWAVVQLRRENAAGSLLNLVGFQTNLKFSEQKRVFSLIPALHDAEFVRYGVMHRNSFLNSPRLLNMDWSLRKEPRLYFAGQLTGVEGYMESAMSGLWAGRNAARALAGQPPVIPPEDTMAGALTRFVTGDSVAKFEPMGANFGVLPPLSKPVRDKKLRYRALAERALESMKGCLRE